MKWFLDNWQLALILTLSFIAGVFKIRSTRLQARIEKMRAEASQKDFENAQDIRRRVSDDRADRVRTLDDAGYRD